MSETCVCTPPYFHSCPRSPRYLRLSSWPYARITCHPRKFTISFFLNSERRNFFPLPFLLCFSFTLDSMHSVLMTSAVWVSWCLKAFFSLSLWSQVTLWATTRAAPSLQKTEIMTLPSLTVPCLTKEPGGTRTATGPTWTGNTASPDTVRSVH